MRKTASDLASHVRHWISVNVKELKTKFKISTNIFHRHCRVSNLVIQRVKKRYVHLLTLVHKTAFAPDIQMAVKIFKIIKKNLNQNVDWFFYLNSWNITNFHQFFIVIVLLFSHFTLFIQS